MKDNHEIRIKCNKEQHDKIKQKAESVGMTIKGLILHLVKNTQIKIVVE